MRRPCDLACSSKAWHKGRPTHARVTDSSPTRGARQDPIQLSVQNYKRLNFKNCLGSITYFFAKRFEASRIYTSLLRTRSCWFPYGHLKHTTNWSASWLPPGVTLFLLQGSGFPPRKRQAVGQCACSSPCMVGVICPQPVSATRQLCEPCKPWGTARYCGRAQSCLTDGDSGRLWIYHRLCRILRMHSQTFIQELRKQFTQ